MSEQRCETVSLPLWLLQISILIIYYLLCYGFRVEGLGMYYVKSL
jgi:hypothetical protein